MAALAAGHSGGYCGLVLLQLAFRVAAEFALFEALHGFRSDLQRRRPVDRCRLGAVVPAMASLMPASARRSHCFRAVLQGCASGSKIVGRLRRCFREDEADESR